MYIHRNKSLFNINSFLIVHSQNCYIFNKCQYPEPRYQIAIGNRLDIKFLDTCS